MADVATPASLNVVADTRTPVSEPASGALALLCPVYRGTDGRLYPAEAAGDSERALVSGLCVVPAGALDDMAGYVLRGATLRLPGTPLTPRAVYALSKNPGFVCPIADLTDEMNLSIVGYAPANNELTLLLDNTGVRVKAGGSVAHLTDDVANATVVTVKPHGRATGDSVLINGTGTGYDTPTHGAYTVTVVDAYTFTLGYTVNAVGDVTVGRWYLP